MSLPEFPTMPDNVGFDDIVSEILTSIAMEEIGLSHILNAEGEKLQYVLGTADGENIAVKPSIEEILEVNEAVRGTIAAVSMNQIFLYDKLSSVLKAFKVWGEGPKTPGSKAYLTVTKKDRATGEPISGTTFGLRPKGASSGGPQAVTNSAGIATFSNIPIGEYTFLEETPNSEYQHNGTEYKVIVDSAGNVTIEGVAKNSIQLDNVKKLSMAIEIIDRIHRDYINNTEMRLRPIDTGRAMGSEGILLTSDENGLIYADGLEARIYELLEETPAPNFQPNDEIYEVVVDQSGHVTINGESTLGFVIENTPHTVTLHIPEDSDFGEADSLELFANKNGFTIPDNPFDLNDGYVFASWNTMANGQGEQFNVGDSINLLTANKDLYLIANETGGGPEVGGRYGLIR
ncbi:MAG: prealbumin-like fold domain-containing protein [Eubacteriaceae bacterium]|nr:prealbumin-like fold domain-containing protein [Eubacteriaceae bacterium]